MRTMVITLYDMLKASFIRWWGDNTFLYGAALSYYTVSAIAPVVLIAIAIASIFFGQQAAEGRIAEEISNTLGPAVGNAIQETVKASSDLGHGPLAAAIGIVLLILGATTVFAQLQEALNTIWRVKPKPDRGIWSIIRDRFLSFAVVLAIGFVLLVSLVFSTVLASISNWVTPTTLPGGTELWHGISMAFSFVSITVLFAMIYKLLPDAEITWRDVWVGAIVTALLFTIGKYLIGLYLGKSGAASAYGAAGSLVLILLWVYYSSQIFLFGAEFTYIYSHRTGHAPPPSDNAVAIGNDEAGKRAGKVEPAAAVK